MKIRLLGMVWLTLAVVATAEGGKIDHGHSGSSQASTSDISRAVLNGKPSGLKQILQIKIKAPDGEYRCSSSVVSEETIITAAHCVPPGSQIEVNLNSADKGPENYVPMQCEANPGFPHPKPEDMSAFKAAGAAVREKCEAYRGRQDAGATAELAQLESAYMDLMKKAFFLTEDGMRNDVAVCKLKAGKFSVPPAKVAKADPSSGRYLFAGYGCTSYQDSGPQFPTPNEVYEGQADLEPDTSKGYLLARYTKNDQNKAGICPGDSGGALLQKKGDVLELAGVNSGGSNGGKYALDRNVCKVMQKGAESGQSVMTDLSSPSSQKWLSEMVAKGYSINGVGKGVTTNRGDALAGQFPEIKLGVPHDPPVPGGVYLILNSLWQWDGSTWRPAKKEKRSGK